MNTKDTRFSHVGIVVRRPSGVRVIHADMNDTTLAGSVVEVPLAEFLRESKRTSAFRYTGADADMRARIRVEAERLLGRKFDFHFDVSSDSEVYCTELVYWAYNRGAGEPLIPIASVENHRLVLTESCCHARGMVELGPLALPTS